MHVAIIQHIENFNEVDPSTDNAKHRLKGRKNENAPPKPMLTSSDAFLSTQQLPETIFLKSEGHSGSSSTVLMKKLIPTLLHRELNIVTSDENGVPDSIQYPASFKGGNSKYPKLHPKGHATVEVQFSIDRFGNIRKIWIEEESKTCPQSDRAAIYVVKQMPHWEPARLNDSPINSYHRLQITFR